MPQNQNRSVSMFYAPLALACSTQSKLSLPLTVKVSFPSTCNTHHQQKQIFTPIGHEFDPNQTQCYRKNHYSDSYKLVGVIKQHEYEQHRAI